MGINTEPVDAKDATKEKDKNDIVEDVGVLCNSEDITLTLRVSTDTFNGMIYPKGLSKNSTCMTEYIQQEGLITYVVPLLLQQPLLCLRHQCGYSMVKHLKGW